jgi:hypothetical protein
MEPLAFGDVVWRGGEFPLASLEIRVNELAARLNLPVYREQENVISPVLGFGGRLPSGRIFLLEEIGHPFDPPRSGDVVLTVDAADLAGQGAEPLLAEVLQALGLTRSDVAAVGCPGAVTTPAEWDACADPAPLLRFVLPKPNYHRTRPPTDREERLPTDRRTRLLACAWCRHVWHLLTDARSRRSVEVAELYADGAANPAQLEAAEVGALPGRDEPQDVRPQLRAAMSAAASSVNLPETMRQCEVLAPSRQEPGWQAILVRCLFRNPFGPAPPVDPAWLTWRDGTVAKLLDAIYHGRRFADLPVLGDALEEAGCSDAAILAHCRTPGEHARGCWVVDLLTGRR